MLKLDFTGAVSFTDDNGRIAIPLLLAGRQEIVAMVDTGATYSILAPNVVAELGIDLTIGYRPGELKTWRGSYEGWLCRIPVTLKALYGEDIDLEPNFFIPDNGWPDNLNFVGLQTFLFEIPFAIDPRENLFYFGKPI